jgi:branched-chain amino acid transport system permease protein
VILVPLQQLLNSSLSAYPAGFNLVVYALVVLVILWIEPRGIMSMRWRRRRKKADPPATTPAATAPEPAPAVRSAR